MSFTRKDNFFICLDKSELKALFHWNTHSEILFKLSFNCFVDKSTSWTTEKMNVSSKSFVIDDKFLVRSLLYIKKKRGPKIEPCGTQSIVGNHVEDWPLSNINFNRGRHIPIDLIL